MPIQTIYVVLNTSDPPDNGRKKKNNKDQAILNEYDVLNSKDELDYDNKSLKYQEEEEETSEALIRTSSPPREQRIDDEIPKKTMK